MVRDLTEDIGTKSRELALSIDSAGTPIDAAFWQFEPENSRWRLHLATPHVVSKGPLAVYSAIQDQLGRLGPPGFRTVELEDMAVNAPDDEIVVEAKDRSYMIRPGAFFVLHSAYVIVSGLRKNKVDNGA